MLVLVLLSILVFISYILGFVINENSIGSGDYNGDLRWIWENFQIFKDEGRRLKDNIVHFGFCENFSEYAKWLWKADLLPITNNQDFFGDQLICNYHGDGKLWIQTRSPRNLAAWVHPFRPVQRDNK